MLHQMSSIKNSSTTSSAAALPDPLHGAQLHPRCNSQRAVGILVCAVSERGVQHAAAATAAAMAMELARSPRQTLQLPERTTCPSAHLLFPTLPVCPSARSCLPVLSFYLRSGCQLFSLFTEIASYCCYLLLLLLLPYSFGTSINAIFYYFYSIIEGLIFIGPIMLRLGWLH
jgi:hypothetical protein